MTDNSRYYCACSVVAVVAALGAPAGAAAQDRQLQFNIPSQDLGAALRAFGQQSGQQIIFSGGEMRGKRNPAVVGAYSADAALDRLLQGSGLSLTRSTAGVLIVQDLSHAAKGQRAEPPRSAPPGPVGDNTLTDEIIVTAQKREENVQNISLAVSAFTGDQMRALNIQDATRIVDLVPNFKAGGLGGPIGPPFFSIRGVNFIDFSNLNEASVGVYVDEVYQAAQGAGAQQLYDAERVEVLRGPQGTLFGRNTTGGVVQYISRKPTAKFGGSVSLQYGQNNQRIATGAVGGPVTDTFRLRAAFKYNRDDGYQKNLAIGGRDGITNALNGRLIAQIDLSPDWMLESNIHYSRNRGVSPTPQPMFYFGPNSGVPGVPSGYCGGLLPPNPAIGGPTPNHSPGDLAWAACVRSNQGYGRNGQQISGMKANQSYSGEHYPFNYEGFGGYLKLQGDMSWATLTSITAYEHYRQLLTFDADGWNNRPITNPLADQRDLAPYFNSTVRQVSQEVRLNGERGGAKWIGGLYVYKAKQSVLNGTDFDLYGDLHGQSYDPFTNNALGCAPGVTAPAGTPACSTAALNQKISAAIETTSYAFFGQVDAPVSPTLTAAVGLRYTHDTRHLTRFDVLPACTTPLTCGPTPVPRIKGGAWTGRAALEWRPQGEALYYAQYSHGFKSGGYSTSRTTSQRGPVQEETIDSWELGMRRHFFDHRLRFNATAFYYKFHGIQALVGGVDANGAAQTLYINAGDPRGYGLELETAWAVTSRLEASLSGGLLNTKVKAPASLTVDGRPLNGNVLAQAPKASLSGVVRYTVPLETAGALTFQADGRWQSSSYAGIENDPAKKIDSYGVINARIQWRSDDRRRVVEAFVDNVLNKTYFQNLSVSTPSAFVAKPSVSAPSVDAGTRPAGRPRLWGVRVSYDF